MSKETKQDEYADDYRNEPPTVYPKNPLSHALNVQENQDGSYFTGAGEGIEPPEIGEFPTAPLGARRGTMERALSGEDDGELRD